MNSPRITIELDPHAGVYRTDDTLAGEFRLTTDLPEEIKAVELSVMWYTVGQGEEDMSVHHFERIAGEEGVWNDFSAPRRFSTELPQSPLSYDGILVKVCWCVRVRAFLPRGKEKVEEISFRLGQVPRAKIVSE